ncbi:MAG: fumarylacetoacetate hydrolase family protein [Dehalococcoidia bacterium]
MATQNQKFARLLHQGQERYLLVDDGEGRLVEGDLFDSYRVTNQRVSLSDAQLLPVARSPKVLAMAINYRAHLVQAATRPEPTQPEPFWKPPTCLIAHEAPIVIPRDAGRVDAEGELVVVIGQRCRNVTKDEALDYVFGYTCGNDVSARVWQRGDIQWWRGKGADTFGPVGPWVVTGLDPAALELRTRVNGEEKQFTPTSEMIFDVPTTIAFISQAVTLEPGDLIFTGTTGITPTINVGDVVEVEISGIGVLRNPVKGEE